MGEDWVSLPRSLCCFWGEHMRQNGEHMRPDLAFGWWNEYARRHRESLCTPYPLEDDRYDAGYRV
jgi:hypothetical protein